MHDYNGHGTDGLSIQLRASLAGVPERAEWCYKPFRAFRDFVPRDPLLQCGVAVGKRRGALLPVSVSPRAEQPRSSLLESAPDGVRLPDFFVIGAYKSGTTALHQLLRQHPEIFVPGVKEPSFFAFMNAQNDRPAPPSTITTWAEYSALFRDCSPSQVAGEVSPAYMTIPATADRIYRLVPRARLIAVLRNPIDRAYSDYAMYVQRGQEKLDFMSALGQLGERAGRGDPTGDYISSGLYGTQLSRYYELFPEGRIHVVLFEEFVANQVSVLADIFAFLGVDGEFEPGPIDSPNPTGLPPNGLVSPDSLRARLYRRVRPARHNSRLRRPRALVSGLIARSFARPPMPPEARDHLTTVFRDEIALTERLTGHDLSPWLMR